MGLNKKCKRGELPVLRNVHGRNILKAKWPRGEMWQIQNVHVAECSWGGKRLWGWMSGLLQLWSLADGQSGRRWRPAASHYHRQPGEWQVNQLLPCSSGRSSICCPATVAGQHSAALLQWQVSHLLPCSSGRSAIFCPAAVAGQPFTALLQWQVSHLLPCCSGKSAICCSAPVAGQPSAALMQWQVNPLLLSYMCLGIICLCIPEFLYCVSVIFSVE
jgi:hypothetical protein